LPIADLLTHLPTMQAHLAAGRYLELTELSIFALRYSERLLSVIDLLLDAMRDGVVRLATDRLTLHSVIEQVCEAVGNQADMAHLRLHNHVPPDLPRIVLDRRLFTHALISLIELLNHANPAAGELHFSAEYADGSARFQLRLQDARHDTDRAALTALLDAPLSALLNQRDHSRAILSRLILRAHGADIQLLPASQGVSLEMSVPLMPAEPSVKRLAAAPLFSD
ncbi:MAG: hypothetical protein ACK4P1_04810, partial [Aggregatilineales bacterium]